MMLQQRGQLGPQQQQHQVGPDGQILRPPASQTSPLLAQHLSGARPQLPPGQQQQQMQMQTQQQQQQQGGQQGQQGGELEGLDQNELGDLGIGEDDLLGENFDIDEFADALDDLDDLNEEDKKNAEAGQGSSTTSGGTSASTSTTSTAAATTATGAATTTVTSGATPATQPPPYTQTSTTTPGAGTGPMIRAPPPPYPGNAAGGPSKVRKLVYLCLLNVPLHYKSFFQFFQVRGCLRI